MMVKNDNDAQCLCMHGSVCVCLCACMCIEAAYIIIPLKLSACKFHLLSIARHAVSDKSARLY